MVVTRRLLKRIIGKLLREILVVLRHVQIIVLLCGGFIANILSPLKMKLFPILKPPVFGCNCRKSLMKTPVICTFLHQSKKCLVYAIPNRLLSIPACNDLGSVCLLPAGISIVLIKYEFFIQFNLTSKLS